MKQKLIMFIVLGLLLTLVAGCSGEKNQPINDGLYLPTSETAEWASLEFKDSKLTMTHRDLTTSTFDYTFKLEKEDSYILSYEVGEGIDRWTVTIINENTIRFSGTVGTFVKQK